MIPAEDNGVLAVARAIAAGQQVDWTSVESSVELSESAAAVLRELKVVAEIAELHRHLDSSAVVSSLSANQTVETTPEIATWGPLRLLERVGQGAFGEVYRAWDSRLDREVALKLLKRVESATDSVGSHVIEEGRLLARVRHPNVVTVYGADRIEGRVGLWMEFVRGRTLEAVLRDQGPFGAQEATLIGLDLLRAVSAVHGAGLIHRDVKAQNVMREDGGRIVLMDFGTGREDLRAAPVELAGTPLYLAPEVFRGETATPHSDVYSVAVLLFHLVTGAYPVSGRTVDEIRRAHTQQKRLWLRDMRPDLHDSFVQVVEQALSRDPDERYATAGAMEAALARVLSRTNHVVGSAETKTIPTKFVALATERFWPPRLGWVAICATIVVASLTAALIVAARRGTALGSPGGSGPTQSIVGGAASNSSLLVRKVPLSDYASLGTPSADGRLFSFTDVAGNVAVLDLASGQSRQVTRDAVVDKASQMAEASVMSPDAQFVAYTWLALDGNRELRVVDIGGKRPRVLVRSDDIDYPMPLEWSRDGRSILALLSSRTQGWLLALISTVDDSVQPVKRFFELAPHFASLSPDGEFVVYDQPQEPSASRRDIFIVRSDGSDDRRLIEFPATDVNPVWAPDGRSVFFVSDRSGTLDLWRITVNRGFADGEPEVVYRNIGSMSPLGLTANGSFYYQLALGSVDVYEARFGDNAVTGRSAVPTTYLGSNISSLWSPDGTRLAYTSRRGPVRFDREWTTVVIRDLRTNEQREIVPDMNSFLLRSWSPDGHAILVSGADAKGRTGAHRIEIETAEVSPMVLNPPDRNDIRRVDWLADGKVLYINSAKRALISRDPRSGIEQMVVDLRVENLNIVAHVYGRGHRRSPDGRDWAYTAAERNGDTQVHSIWVRSFDGGVARQLVRVSGPELILLQDWIPDGTAVLFTRWNPQTGEAVALWRAPLDGGDPHPLGIAMEGLRDVSVHPDGSRLTFTGGWPKMELWMMTNFLGPQ